MTSEYGSAKAVGVPVRNLGRQRLLHRDRLRPYMARVRYLQALALHVVKEHVLP